MTAALILAAALPVTTAIGVALARRTLRRHAPQYPMTRQAREAALARVQQEKGQWMP